MFIVAKILKKKNPFRKLIPIILGIILILSATTLRNRIIGGSWTLISAQSGLSFFVGNNANATGSYSNPKGIRPTHKGQDEDQRTIAEHSLKRPLSSSEVSAFWRNKAFRFIVSDPTSYLKLQGKKTVLFLSENERSFDLDLIFQKDYKKRLDLNPFFILCPLACIGMFLTRKKKRGSAEYAKFLILSQFFFTLIFFLSNRHRATILPFVMIFEAVTLFWFVEKLRQKQWKKLIPAILFTIVFILFI